MTLWRKPLSCSLWLPGEDYYPAASAIYYGGRHYPAPFDSLGKNISQLHLELTLWRSTLSSFFWLSGEGLLSSSIYNWLSRRKHYSAPSDSLGETLSSSIWNWLSEGRHYPVPCDSLRKIIIQLHLQLTMGGRWHNPALSDTLGKIIIQLYLQLTHWGKTVSSSV